MNMFKKMLNIVIMMIGCITVHAQSSNAEAMSLMRSNGKIYVVVAVVVTILLGLFLYLYNLDRKITKLEKK